MSAHDEAQGSGLKPSDVRTRSAYPACQLCTRPMTVKQVTPLLVVADTEEIVFGCEDCATEVKRTVRRAPG